MRVRILDRGFARCDSGSLAVTRAVGCVRSDSSTIKPWKYARCAVRPRHTREPILQSRRALFRNPASHRTGLRQQCIARIVAASRPHQKTSLALTCARLALVPSGKPADAFPAPRPGVGFNTPPVAVKACVKTEVFEMVFVRLNTSKFR